MSRKEIHRAVVAALRYRSRTPHIAHMYLAACKVPGGRPARRSRQRLLEWQSRVYWWAQVRGLPVANCQNGKAACVAIGARAAAVHAWYRTGMEGPRP